MTDWWRLSTRDGAAGACFSRQHKDEDSTETSNALVVQQLKLAREQLAKRSEFCDTLVERIRRLEADLARRHNQVDEERALRCAVTSELRSATYMHRASEAKHVDALDSLHRHVDVLQDEVRSAQSRDEACEEMIAQLKERETQAWHHQAEAGAIAEARINDAAELRQELAENELRAQQLSAQMQDSKDAWLEEAASLRSAVRAQCAAESATCAQRLRDEAAEMTRSLAALVALPREEITTRITSEESAWRDTEEEARSAAAKSEESVQLLSQEQSLVINSPVSPTARRASVDVREEMGIDAHRRQLEADITSLKLLLSQASGREQELKISLRNERELHDEAVRLLEKQREERRVQKKEFREELSGVSNALEQKEEDMLTINFYIVELKNQLADQAKLVSENADAFQMASEELADKDEKLADALTRQEELLNQMNEVSSKLQEKVACLSQDLEGSRAAYKALVEQAQSVERRLESERDSLAEELSRVRAERDTEIADLHAKLHDKEVAVTTHQAESQKASEELQVRCAKHEAAAATAAAALVQQAQEAELQRQRREAEHNQALTSERLRCENLSRQVDAALEQARVMKHGNTERLNLAQAKQAGSEKQEAESQEALRALTHTNHDLQEELATVKDRLTQTEDQLQTVTASLERSRILEREALAKAQEYRTSMELLREFGKEDFMAAAPRHEALDREPTVVPHTPRSPKEWPPKEAKVGDSALVFQPPKRDESQADGTGDNVEGMTRKMPSVLISVELNLGATTATLSIAPWQSRADFETVVRSFLEEHRVKMVFASALVKYLEEVEAEATAFPACVSADLADLYSQFG